uniref:Elicitin-like protein n=1 Tax=Hyaloperonospora arabidopsidis (strain Emoy2) TaxID=559515 RepID=M4BUG5_HYAAE
MVVDLPNCTFNGINNKNDVQRALAACNAVYFKRAELMSAGSLSSDPLNGGSLNVGSLNPDSLSTGSLNAGSLSTDSLSLNAGSLSTGSPSPDSGSLGSGSLTTMATDASGSSTPDVSNTNSDVIFASSASSLDLTTAMTGSSSSASPSGQTTASEGSTVSCSMAEVKKTWNLFVYTATSNECIEASTTGGYGVEILALCGSDCARNVETLADKLPNCYYDNESVNKKEDVRSQLTSGCNGASKFVSVAIVADSSMMFVSSSGSMVVSESDASGSTSFNSGTRPDDETLESSNFATGSSRTNESSAAPSFDAQLHLWTLFLIGIVVAYAS